MEKNSKESQKEKISKMMMNSLIDNYSMKTVIQNLYSKKKTEYDELQSSLLCLKNQFGLSYLTNLLYDYNDKLTFSDIKDIQNNDINYNNNLLSKKRANKNSRNSTSISTSSAKNKDKNTSNNKTIIENNENNIIINKSNINFNPNISLYNNKNEYTSKLRSNNNKKELHIVAKASKVKSSNHKSSKNKDKDKDKEKDIDKDKDKEKNNSQKKDSKLYGFKKKFSKKSQNNGVTTSKYIKENNVLLKNIEQSKLPKGLIIESTDESNINIENIESNPDEIFFEEEYSKNRRYFSKNRKLDTETMVLQNKILGKDIRLGSHFNRDEKGNLYLYNISMYGKNGLVKMKCSNQACKANALYNFISKIFYLTGKHNVSAENHRLRNTPSFRALDYVNFLERHKDILDLQILKVPKDKFCKINCIAYVIEKECMDDNNYNNPSSYYNNDFSQDEYEENSDKNQEEEDKKESENNDHSIKTQ
jgi:hypothetical protein